MTGRFFLRAHFQFRRNAHWQCTRQEEKTEGTWRNRFVVPSNAPWRHRRRELRGLVYYFTYCKLPWRNTNDQCDLALLQAGNIDEAKHEGKYNDMTTRNVIVR